jgi:uncharacterized small protein (DUF1192 family)
MSMTLFDDDAPQKKRVHEIGQDLSLLSVTDLDERVAILQDEITRVKQARETKQASKSAADAFFRKG